MLRAMPVTVWPRASSSLAMREPTRPLMPRMAMWLMENSWLKTQKECEAGLGSLAGPLRGMRAADLASRDLMFLDPIEKPLSMQRFVA
jgi:hypothetical protein